MRGPITRAFPIRVYLATTPAEWPCDKSGHNPSPGAYDLCDSREPSVQWALSVESFTWHKCPRALSLFRDIHPCVPSKHFLVTIVHSLFLQDFDYSDKPACIIQSTISSVDMCTPPAIESSRQSEKQDVSFRVLPSENISFPQCL